MSFVGSMFDDAKGAGFQGGGADLQKPVTNDQAAAAYGQTQQGLAQQQAFLQALQGQNGIQNQSDVYSQLQGVANGAGPNPAQAMLANATGNNVQAQSAMMAGQRGSGANTGLLARQAGMVGANAQQQAVGQGAALQANQSMNALGQMGNLASTQVGQQSQGLNNYNQFAQGEQGNLLSGVQGQNNAAVGMQSNQNNVNAGIAQGNQAFQQKEFGAVQNKAMQGLAMAHGGQVPHMADGGIMAPQAPTTSGDFASSYAKGLSSYAAQQPNIGAPMGNPYLAEERKEDSGGGMPSMPGGAAPTSGASSGMMGGAAPASAPMAMPIDPSMAAMALAKGGKVGHYDDGGIASLMPLIMMLSQGGKVPAMVSPGEVYLSPDKVNQVAAGKDPIEAGEKIPGKPKVKGDSLKNDVVPKPLEEGGIVLPNSIMQAKHPHWEAHKFVMALMAKNKLKK